MIDKNTSEFPVQNIRSLLHEVTVSVDSYLQDLRSGTRYEKVRDSDVKVFMRAFRSSATVSDIARSLGVTRQAVHASVLRLMELKILELQAIPDNKRDKLVVITERGRHAQDTALQQISIIEDHMAAVIGKRELKVLRAQLAKLAQSFKPPA